MKTVMNNVEENQQKRDKKTMVPRLRFPEFNNADDWKKKPLGDVAFFFKGKGLPKSEISLNATNLCIHYGELFSDYSEVITSVRSRTNLEIDCFFSVENDVLMPTSDVTPRGLAKACCIKLNDVILGGDILVIRSDKLLMNGEFLSRLIRYYESQVLQLVSGSTVFHLYASSMEKMVIVFPGIEEQQKIADCLSSLDDLIDASAKKLELLKDHKKGLMQKLFPAENETIPKFRFPEFKNAPEWKKSCLEEIAKFITDRLRLEQLSLNNYISTENMLPDFGQIKTASKLPTSGSVTKFQANDILISNIRPYLKKVWFSDKAGGASNDVIIIRSKKIVIEQFLLFLLKNEIFINYMMKGVKGVKMPRGDISLIKKYQISYPFDKNEQKSLVKCLCSLDDLITAQTQKLDTLKKHKKGLMQQLFPVMDNEVSG